MKLKIGKPQHLTGQAGNMLTSSSDNSSSRYVAHGISCLRYLVLVWLWALPLSSEAADAKLMANVGSQTIVFPAGYHGLNYFPDEPISVISEKPYQFLMTVSRSSVLMQGRTLESAVPVEKVLLPGTRSEFDNGYAGIASAVYDKKTKRLMAFYHAEDQVGMPKVSYNKDIQGAYWSIGMAVLNDGATEFTKAGQILSPSVKKADVTEDHQGIGDVCVIADATNTYLYAYFTNMNRRKNSFPANIGMARCRMADGGKRGSWMKYHNGGFNENGIGGLEGPVVFPPSTFPSDVYGPHVTYIKEMQKYVMVCNVMVYSDHEKQRAEKGGIFFCFSDDGVKWSEPKSLVVGHPVPYKGRQYVAHPHLMIDRESSKRASGWLLYCYSPRWGISAPNQPHHFAKRSITISVQEESTKETLAAIRAIAKEVKVDAAGEPVFVDLTGVRVTIQELSHLSKLSSITRLVAPKAQLNDAGMEHVSKLSNLTSLNIWKTRITSDGLRHVSRLHNLRYLNVSVNRNIKDDGLKHLSGLRRLSWLSLSYTGVTDHGMLHLASLPSLNRLVLAHTKLTDRGLDQLTQIKSLKTLTITGTKVTASGVAKFKRTLPNCNVIR